MKREKLTGLALFAAVLLFLLTACGGAQQTDETPAPMNDWETVFETLAPLMEDDEDDVDYPAFGSPTLTRKQVRSITFLSDASDAPADSWAVFQEQNGSAVAWAVANGELYDLFIASDGGVTAPENCCNLFFGYSNVESIAFNGAFDTSHVTNMSQMFWSCESLTELDVSGFDTSNVTYMVGMFSYCESLTTLDLSGFDTSNVTDMDSMFWGCEGLKALDLSAFDTSNVTDMSYMFWGCESLTTLDLSAFDTSNVTDMSYMFSYCESLTELDISGWDTSNVTDMSNMFRGCHGLTALDVSGFDTSNVECVEYMFYDCSAVTQEDVGKLDLSNATDTSKIFGL